MDVPATITALRRRLSAFVSIVVLCLAGSITPAHTATAVTAAANASEASPISGSEPCLLLISIDGFRHDYLDLYPTPALARIAESGVRARSLRPAWPTLTFPNHYSIVTGLYPAEHGIVGNRFPHENDGSWYEYTRRESVQDPRWYGGVPVWVTAERAGLRTAAFYFVGSEAPIRGIRPSDWHAFDAGVSGEARVAQVLAWLSRPAATRPRLVMLYFEHVDVAAHRYGPGSPQSVAAIRRVDGWLGDLQEGIAALPVASQMHIVVVSDHGQARYRDDAELFVLEDVVDLDGVEVVEHGSLAMLFLNDDEAHRARRLTDAINRHWRHGRAWLRDQAPAEWHVKDGTRVADVLLQADPGYGLVSSRKGKRSMTRGDHGWSPAFEQMHGIFLAAGPTLPKGKTIDTIEVVDVYPMLLGILDLEPGAVTDPR